ncbi:hypothetical protein [Pseudomonas parafulva]|uniref:Uncharacterized protein n=1 Tax=Pseudomonas parafulva TaxID=157782 RepID=A0AAJ0LIP1_9PSED|nr:hypothetical protein [Pseudomonas parafulva]KTT16891.1 hypothetical protein NS96R_14155 [Pseudomonas parafulva]
MQINSLGAAMKAMRELLQLTAMLVLWLVVVTVLIKVTGPYLDLVMPALMVLGKTLVALMLLPMMLAIALVVLLVAVAMLTCLGALILHRAGR